MFKRAQVKIGREFEEIFYKRAHTDGWSVDRIADGCKTYGKNKMFRTTQPFDFVGHKDGKYFFVDCKSWAKKTFSKSDITEHQAISLKGKESINGIAGYVVWFRSLNEIVFFSASKLLLLKDGERLVAEDGVALGSLRGMDLRKFGGLLG